MTMRLPLIPLLASMAAFGATAEVTYYKHIVPVLQKNCQSCHRAGEAAPMSFTSYELTRPWAKSIKAAVLTRKMPPWFADPSIGKFHNDRTMAQSDIDLLVKWADTGAKAGNPKDAPAPLEFAQGWLMPEPDVVFEMPEAYSVPADGTIEYTYYVVPTGFTEDKWVQMAEARPGDRRVVHHIIAFIREPGSKWLKDAPVGKPFVPAKGEGQNSGLFLAGYAPGMPAAILRDGQAALVKAGSDVVFQMHYTTNGTAASDKSRVGMRFSRVPVEKRVLTLAAANSRFVIPAGADNHEVAGKMTLYADAELISLMPHMHLRGKAFDMRAQYPTGETERLLSVPRYDFNWQLWYETAESKPLPKGTTIHATGWFDNSPNNKANPNPNTEVRYGDQSWEEMMIGFFNVAIDVNLDPAQLMRPPKKKAPSSGAGAGAGADGGGER